MTDLSSPLDVMPISDLQNKTAKELIGTLFALPSCLPYIHVCPKCPFLWFALHGHFFMVCPTSCLPYIDCCPACQFLWPQNVSFVTSGSPYFMFALSRDVIALHLFALQKMLPYQMYFFQRIFKIFVRSVTNVVGIYLWYIMYHL